MWNTLSLNVTSNKERYQKSVQLKFMLSWSVITFTISFFDYAHSERVDSLWNRSYSQISDKHDLNLDLGSGHTVMYRSSTSTNVSDLR